MRLHVRADGSPDLGYGHVMRSLAVAEIAVARSVDVVYVTSDDPTTREVVARDDLEHRVVAAPSDATWVKEVEPGDLVLIDGYHLPDDLIDAARARSARVGVIDDLGRSFEAAHVVVDPSHAGPSDLRARRAQAVLRGTEHALVRQEFRQHRRRRGGPAGTLGITFGGADVAGLTPHLVAASRRSQAFARTLAIVGPAADASLPTTPGLEVVRAPRSMATVLDACDAVVAAAGATTWELLTMGMPTAVVQVAANQAGVIDLVTRAGSAIVIADPTDEPSLDEQLHSLADPVARDRLSGRALDHVDGLGAARVFAALAGSGHRSK